jgi:hypothetical protein
MLDEYFTQEVVKTYWGGTVYTWTAIKDKQEEFKAELKKMEGKFYKKMWGGKYRLYRVDSTYGLNLRITRYINKKLNSSSLGTSYCATSTVFTFLRKLEEATEEDVNNKKIEWL